MKAILKIGQRQDHLKKYQPNYLNAVGVAAMKKPKYLLTSYLIMQGQHTHKNPSFLISNRRRVMKANKNRNNGAGQQRKSHLQKQNQ
jgi:hypothetical protein